ncbi:MAG TPA: rhodanese-like domain-containing protein [Thermoanaerobaculia bacterium]|nr:rhodanese-like domain-containing protein [Thermoanaerobaculia bacterium]
MHLRRHLAETVTLASVAVAIALVSNAFASKERKLRIPGDYPNATSVARAISPEGSSAPVQAGSAESSPATAQFGSAGIPSKGDQRAPAAAPIPQGSAGTGAVATASKKTPSSSAPPASSKALQAPDRAGDSDLLVRFPPHPDRPWVEISGEDAALLHRQGVLFLDARRTKDYELGHVRGARAFSVWESDVDEKTLALLGVGRDALQPVVLYCSGGECEDSHMLGQKLFGAGFNNLLVYRGGFPDWVSRGGAVTRGANP